MLQTITHTQKIDVESEFSMNYGSNSGILYKMPKTTLALICCLFHCCIHSILVMQRTLSVNSTNGCASYMQLYTSMSDVASRMQSHIVAHTPHHLLTGFSAVHVDCSTESTCHPLLKSTWVATPLPLTPSAKTCIRSGSGHRRLPIKRTSQQRHVQPS